MMRRIVPVLHAPERWRLANRLAFSMVVVAALAILLLFYDTNQANRAEIEALQVTNLTNSTHDLAKSLDALVTGQIGRISNLAVSRSVVEFVGVAPDQRSALFTPTLDDFANFINSSPFYRAVVLLDARGEVLISTDGSYIGQRFGSSAFFQQTALGQAFMSDPGISRLDRQPVIWLAAPVATANERRAAVVAVALSPEWLWQYIDQVRLGNNGYAMLLDQYGIRLAHGGDRRYIFRSLEPLPAATWAQLQREDRFGSLAAIQATNSASLLNYVQHEPLAPTLIAPPGPGSEQVYYSAARMQTRNWTVVAMLAEHEILAPANRVTQRGIGATLLVSVLLGLTVWWMTERILRPVPLLTQAATAIAGGDLSTPITIQGSSELHALAENFEVMRHRLSDSRTELAKWAATLETRVARRSGELAALSEVVAAASHTQSRTQLLHTALQQSLRVVGADLGGIWLADVTGALHLMATEGFDYALQDSLTSLAPGEGVLGQVQTQGVAVALSDISQAPRLSRVVVREKGLHAFAAVPLRIHGRTLGVMGMFSRSSQAFTPDSVALATSIGQQIALTLDNLTLLEQVQAQARAVTSLQERERIAGDLHDGVVQVLGYLHLQTDRLADDTATTNPQQLRERLLAMRDVLDQATGDVRQFVAQLQEAPPAPIWLGAALQHETDRLALELDVAVTMTCTRLDDRLISAASCTEVLRIVGEAARNARHHGHADTIDIALDEHAGAACLSIHDNGCGFDLAAMPDTSRPHFGLSVMRARAERLGGALELVSARDAGTWVVVRWPL